MRLPADLLCQLLAPWLLFQEMLLLDVSCRETHREFRRLMRTPQVSKIIADSVYRKYRLAYFCMDGHTEDYPSLSMLDWIRHNTVMDDGTIHVTDALLHALASPTAVPTDPYCFVKRIVFCVGSAESLAMFVAVCPVHFPRVEELRFRVSESMFTSSFGDVLLHALNALASQWALVAVDVFSRSSEKRYCFAATPDHVDQLLSLIVKLGPPLRVFDLHYFTNLPVSVLAQLSEHCPNCDSMLSAGFYDASVSNALYLQYCSRLRKSKYLSTNDRDASLTDALLIPALREHGNLTSLNIDKVSVGCTMASVVAALQLCPSILNVNYHNWLSVYTYRSADATSSNDLSIRMQSLHESSPQLGELRDLLPTIHSLHPAPISLMLRLNIFTTKQAACLSDCLESAKTSLGVTKLHIDCQVAQLSDVTLLTSRLGNLQELSLSDLHAVAFGQSFAAFVGELRQACPQLSWLSLGQPCAMEDGDVSVLVAQLSSLRSLSILPADAASHRLTRAVLSVLGSAGKVWDRLEVRHVCSARDVLEGVGQLQHGLRARNLAFTSCVGGRQYQFKSWVATAEDVERVCKKELEEQRRCVV